MCEISVIIPVYNAKKHIEKCINSILKQSFTDFEILVIDDGSTDETCAILEERFSDKRLRIIKKINEGASLARKTGVEASLGKYVMFVDADDWVEKDFLKKMHAATEESKAEIVCCNIVAEDGLGKVIDTYAVKEKTVYDAPKALKAMHYMQGVYMYMWNKIFRKEIFLDVVFPEGVFIGEDYYLLVHLFAKAKKIVQIPENLYHYVLHGGNITNNGFNEIYRLAYKNYKDIKAYLLDNFPSNKKDIISYFTLQEMAIVNAMFRNEQYDKEIFNEIRKDLRKNMFSYIFDRNVKLLYRGSNVAMVLNWKLYKKIYLLSYEKGQRE